MKSKRTEKQPVEQFQIPADFKDYAPPAILRLRYLFPDCDFVLEDNSETLSVILPSAPLKYDLKQEIYFSLYRERIFSETISIRKNLYGD